MKGVWLALGLVAVGSMMANVGCSDDSRGSGGSGGSSSTADTSSSSTASTSTSMASSSSSGSSGAYATCSDCSAETGAAAKECMTQHDACLADTGCKDLYAWAYNNTTIDKIGGCAVLDYIKANSIPANVVNLFKAVDNCIYCTTCKAVCEPNSIDYCDAVNGTTPCL